MKKNAFFILYLIMTITATHAQKEIIIDADTGNEMDDLYAITYALMNEDAKVSALISAHFNNVQLLTDSMWNSYPTKNINTLEISQQLNEKILEELDMTDIPHPRGCEKMIGYSWGYYPGAQIPDAPAVNYIIKQARNASPENKVNIVVLGAVTNVAVALERSPEIAKNIRLYILSMKYDVEKQVWNKNSFNANNDRNGLDLILNNKELELFVIPGQVSKQMVFNKQKTKEKLAEYDNEISRLLSERWESVNAGDTWIMWDLALVQAIIYPKMATLDQRMAPPENTQRKINVYIDIDEEKMRKAFWKTYRKYFD